MGAYEGVRTRFQEQGERTRHTGHELQFRKFLLELNKDFVVIAIVKQWSRCSERWDLNLWKYSYPAGQCPEKLDLF